MELQTTRCWLRHPTLDDRPAVVSLFVDPLSRRYLGGPLDEGTGQKRFDLLLRRRDFAWVVLLKDEPGVIGLIDLDIYPGGSDVEVSYEFLPAYWGKGYASEAVRRVVVHAMTFLHTNRIIAETQVDNTPSRRMLERIGMHLERQTEHYGRPQCIYSIQNNPLPPMQ